MKRFRAKVSGLAERRENGRGGKSARRWDAEWATDEYMSTACPSADDDDSEFDLTDDDVEISAVASDAVTELDPVRANLAMEDVPNSENSCYSAEARELIPRADETITVNGGFAKSHQAAEFDCSTAK
jgi:hypothetical protein